MKSNLFIGKDVDVAVILSNRGHVDKIPASCGKGGGTVILSLDEEEVLAAIKAAVEAEYRVNPAEVTDVPIIDGTNIVVPCEYIMK